MTRKIEITLPDTMTIKGCGDAPEALRTVSTDKWTEAFVLTALLHGISQRLGDTWSVSKKDAAKLEAVWLAVQAGEWAVRQSGVAGAKLDAAIQALDITQLAAKLTPAQMVAIAELCKKAI